MAFWIADNLEVVGTLIKAGASLEASDLHFGTPLHVAAYKNHVEAARLLLQAGKGMSKLKKIMNQMLTFILIINTCSNYGL